jgi:nucleoside-diphosphate-sugar epimerase
MKKILILGSEGFIGNYLVNYFLRKQCAVHGCDLFEATKDNYTYNKVSRLSPELEDIFAATKFDYCVNAAGSGNVPYSITHPLVDFEANTLDVIRILDTIRRVDPSCQYLHISSAAVYGNPVRLPITEDDQKRPLSPYGWHKLQSELLCAEYAGIYGIKTAIIRPFSVYGDGLRKQLLWDMCKRLKEHDTIELFGTGQESRDFIHVNDLTTLIALLLEKAAFNGEAYNAASGSETTIFEISQLVEAYYAGAKKITFSGAFRKGDPLNWKADISTVRSLGFSPSILLNKGVPAYIRWFETTQK